MKGNAIVGQSGGPTAVINASLCGVIQGALASSKIGRIFGMRWGIEGFLREELTDLGAERSDTIEALRSTPSSALGSCRYKLADDDLPRVRDLLDRYGIRYLFLIGGNDTMDTIHRIEHYCRATGYDLIGVGVPKTVDNDLFGTDHTPGYGSAARYVALSVQQAGRLAEDMQKVDRFVVHQTVGRNAGWLAAASALARRDAADAPHLIYLPERPLAKARLLSEVDAAIAAHGWASIVCGEGILWEDGTPVSQSRVQDGFANLEFGAMGGTSAAIVLHRIIAEELGARGEFQITESLPMCASDRRSETDHAEAYQCGRRAVELADGGTSGVMVSLLREDGSAYAVRYGTSPLEEVAQRAKPLPDSFIAESGSFVTQAFLDYARPLVGELPPFARLRQLPAKRGAQD